MTDENVVPAIEVEGLRKVYKRLVAVDNVSFVMNRGEAFLSRSERCWQKYRGQDSHRTGCTNARCRACARTTNYPSRNAAAHRLLTRASYFPSLATGR